MLETPTGKWEMGNGKCGLLNRRSLVLVLGLVSSSCRNPHLPFPNSTIRNPHFFPQSAIRNPHFPWNMLDQCPIDGDWW